MLSLDRPGYARSRRQGQHVRNPADLACMDALAVMMRNDEAGAGRYLSRLARTVLAVRLRPAAAALTGAPGTRPWKRPRLRQVELRFTVSVPCLLGQCRVSGDGPGCQSSVCEHECHQRERTSDGASAGAGDGG